MSSDRFPTQSSSRRRFMTGAAALACAPAFAGEDEALVAAARREDGLALYSSMPQADMQTLAAAFRQRFGIEISVWRAGSERILQRAMAETRAGRHAADVVETNAPELEALARAGAFREIASAAIDGLIAGARPSHRLWAGVRVNLIVQAVNTRLVPAGERPGRWDDLADPRWKDRIAVEAHADDWFGTLTDALGGQAGRALFSTIAQRNGMSVRKGHSLLTQLVAAGEVPLALTTYAYRVQQLADGGAPIQALAPQIGRVNGVGILTGARSPNAARLFVDYMLGDAQMELARNHHLPAQRKVAAPLLPPDLRLVDHAADAPTLERWNRDFTAMLAQGRR
jgi:iron(III) transport system substrate-binding protein